MPAPTAAEIARAAEVLRNGGLVAFPTETVYGLGADASSRDALHRLYAVKGRPADHPVIVHLASADQLAEWAAEVSDDARALADSFWPGPLTLVLPRSDRVPTRSRAGCPTVALRVPDQPVALALLARVRWRTGGAVGQPVRSREPDVGARRARRPRRRRRRDPRRRTVPRRVSSRRSSTAPPAHPPSSASEASRASASKTCSVDRFRFGPTARCARPARCRRTTRPARASRSSRRPSSSTAHARELQRGVRVGVLTPKLPHDLPPSAVVVGTPADPDEYARSLYRLLRAADDQRPRRGARGRATRGRDRCGGGRPAAARRGCPRCMTARSACSTPVSVAYGAAGAHRRACPTRARSTSVTPADSRTDRSRKRTC